MRIGALNSDCTLQTIYLSANGYFEDAGADLLEYWNSEQRARLLISGGAISMVGKFFDEQEADKYEEKLIAICKKSKTKYVGNCREFVRGYHTYKDNPFPVEQWTSLEEFYADECWGFVFGLYLWQNGAWYYIHQLPQAIHEVGFENVRAKEPVLLKNKMKNYYRH